LAYKYQGTNNKENKASGIRRNCRWNGKVVILVRSGSLSRAVQARSFVG
jgi:hypothetical protein